MFTSLKKKWDLILGLLVLWSLVIIILLLTLSFNQNRLVYNTDDAYIHMAIAKNLAKYGIWGINKDKFSSSSSSILYTLLLALLFLIFGINEIIPFVINTIFATLIVIFCYKIFNNYYKTPRYATFFILLAIILFPPLPRLIFIGMEHVIQIFINVCFVFYTVRFLFEEIINESENKKNINHQYFILFILAPLVTMIRYEGIFLIIISSFLFLLRKKIFLSLIIGFLGFLPITIYGIISLSYGWYFFPNPIVIKGATPEFSSTEGILNSLGLRSIRSLISHYHLFSLILGCILILIFNFHHDKKLWKSSNGMVILFILLTLSHLQFARAGIWSRYDSYLVVIGIIVIGSSIKDIIPPKLSLDIIYIYFKEFKMHAKPKILIRESIILFVSIFIFSSLFYKGIPLMITSPQASKNIHEQHYQMGLFIEKYYKGECVAVNDIGAVSYLSDVEIIDLWGLADKEVADSRLDDSYDNETIDKITKKHNCKIALLNDYFDRFGGLPSQWVLVGKWTAKVNKILGDDTVYFYAVDPDEAENLIENLIDFSDLLPKDIEESGNYTKT